LFKTKAAPFAVSGLFLSIKRVRQYLVSVSYRCDIYPEFGRYEAKLYFSKNI